MFRLIRSTIIICLGLIFISSNLNAQCPDERLDFINFEPEGANSQQSFRVILAKQFPDACSGLQGASLVSVDIPGKQIIIQYDQFCFDSMNCAQVVHCDTAHFIFSNLPVGDYQIMVVDSNMGNHTCAGASHETDLGGAIYTVKDIFLSAAKMSGPVGSIQCVPFTVDGFANLTDMQSTFRWDSNKARFDTIRDLYPLQFLSPFNINSPRPGEMRFIWLDDFVTGQYVDDGATLFELCFELIGAQGDTVTFDFNDGPLTSLATDSLGRSFKIITSNGQIIIDDNRFSICEADTALLLCEDWLKDTMVLRMEDFCGDSTNLELDLVSWRGYEIIRLTTTQIMTNGMTVGTEEFFDCSGEVIGNCQIGGIAAGICDNLLLQKDVSFISQIWSCGDKLPGCYTTSSKDIVEDVQILKYNLASESLELLPSFHAKPVNIIGMDGKIIQVTNGQNGIITLDGIKAGVYYIQVEESIQKFVVIR